MGPSQSCWTIKYWLKLKGINPSIYILIPGIKDSLNLRGGLHRSFRVFGLKIKSRLDHGSAADYSINIEVKQMVGI